MISTRGIAQQRHGDCNAHPQKFLFVENPGEIPENPGKNSAQRCSTSKNGAQRLQKNT